MDWSGSAPPTTEDLAGRRLRAEGSMHVRAISRNGGQVMGHRPLALDAIEPGLFLDRSPDDPGCQVQRGMDVLGVASPEQRRTLPTLSTWGYGVVVVLAEKIFVLGESSIHS